MVSRTQPWHRPPVLADPRWFSFNGDENGSPFASAPPLYGMPSGLGDPAEEYGEPADTPLVEALYHLMERLTDLEQDVLSMRAVAGMPLNAIAREHNWILPSGTPDRKKVHRIAARATRKLRRWIAEDPDLADLISRPRAAA